MSMEKHPLHLKTPDLHTSPEVERAAEKVLSSDESRDKAGRNRILTARKLEGPHEEVRIPSDPAARIEAYMDRLENIFFNPDERTRERNLDLFRDKIYDVFLIKRDKFPESYFELQQRVARERGQAVEVIPETAREQMKNVAIEDQKASLDAWIDYLTSPDAVYPAWFKYFVWKNVTKLSQFDKERGEFKKRTDSTVAPFPDIYREPLAQIADIYEKVKADNKTLKEPEIKEAFSKKFPSLYAELIQKSLATSLESREEIKGEWVKYEQGDDSAAEKLFASLEGKGTGWCTAGHSTAEAQIKSGDFYVYYTNDASGEPKQPRLAIRMEGTDKIGEVRGVLPHQNVEPIMQEVLGDKLKEFGPEADRYHKKTEDMQRLTALDAKREKNEAFSPADLRFLYELDSKIEGFGYQRDPRIAEILKNRNPKEDAPIVLDCKPEEIAWGDTELTETTKAYIGPWSVETFNKLPAGITHLYESFPDKKIFLKSFESDSTITSPEIAEKALVEKGYKISDYAKDMLAKTEFSGIKEQYTLVRFSVKELGFPQGATTDEIYAKAQELGLELVPAEGGVQLRLQYPDQSQGEYLWMAMKQITGLVGAPDVWRVRADGGDLWLGGHNARPSYRWDGSHELVFRTRKLES